MTDFYKALLEEINALPASKIAGIEWEDSSYSNDACGSIMYNHDNDQETYVQLFAFETKADAIQELGEQYGTQYSIKVSINGETDWHDAWSGDDREEAMVQAIIEAEKMMSMDAENVPTIEDDLPYKFCIGLEDELNERTKQIEPEWEYCAFGTPTQQVVMYEFGMDDDFPTYVWLVISPNGYVEEGLHFSVIVSVNGERDTVYEGKDRNTAIAFAIAKAVQIEDEWVPNDVEHGFEHEGMWITDRTKSPCGRFDLTEEESLKTYGHPKLQPAQELVKMPITSEEEAREFIFALAKAGLMFHFDDPADDCLAEYGFPKDVLDGIQSQVNKLFDVCKDPFEYAIDAFHEADPDGEKDISEMNHG